MKPTHLRPWVQAAREMWFAAERVEHAPAVVEFPVGRSVMAVAA